MELAPTATTEVDPPRAVGAKIPLNAPGTMFGPRNPVERRSQLVNADEEQIEEGMNPARLLFAVREREVREGGSDVGGDV